MIIQYPIESAMSKRKYVSTNGFREVIDVSYVGAN